MPPLATTAAAAGIFFGAGVGALCRWALALALNGAGSAIPLGTLAANVLGGLLMGIFAAVVDQATLLSPLLRVSLATGFLGGLTTFSAFSAETFALMQRGSHGTAAMLVALHVVLSISATMGGYAAVRWALTA